MWSISSHENGFQLERAGCIRTIPATLAGIKALQRLLINWDSEAKIGSPSFPFQNDLDRMVRGWKESHPALVSLEELGL